MSSIFRTPISQSSTLSRTLLSALRANCLHTFNSFSSSLTRLAYLQAFVLPLLFSLPFYYTSDLYISVGTSIVLIILTKASILIPIFNNRFLISLATPQPAAVLLAIQDLKLNLLSITIPKYLISQLVLTGLPTTISSTCLRGSVLTLQKVIASILARSTSRPTHLISSARVLASISAFARDSSAIFPYAIIATLSVYKYLNLCPIIIGLSRRLNRTGDIGEPYASPLSRYMLFPFTYPLLGQTVLLLIKLTTSLTTFLGTPLSQRTLYTQSFFATLKAPLISIYTSVFYTLQLFLPSYFISKSAIILRATSIIDLPRIPPTWFSLNHPFISLVSLSYLARALLSPLLVIRSSATSLYPFAMLKSLSSLGIRPSSTFLIEALPSLRSLLTRQ